jgi:anthranilate synthase component 2
MAVVDDKNKVCGLQFHPESIMTIEGSKLLKNIIQWVTK